MISRNEDNIITTEDFNFKNEVYGGVGSLLYKNMNMFKDKIALIDSDTGNQYTYLDLLQRCVRTALFLQEIDLKKGDVIAYCSDIHLNVCVPVIASLFTGVIPSFIDTVDLPLLEIQHLILQLLPKVVLTDPCYLEMVQNIVKDANLDVKVITFDDNFFKIHEGEENFKPLHIGDLKETAAIFFSSGSTGVPKGVCLNHYDIIRRSSKRNVEEKYQDLDRKQYVASKVGQSSVWTSYDSMYWAVEFAHLLFAIRRGMCRLISTHFDARKLWHMIEKFKINELHLIPFYAAEMCKDGNSVMADTSSLIRVTSTGSFLTSKYLCKLRELLPNADIYQSYGQTEVGTVLLFQGENKFHREYLKKNPESIGLPVAGIWYKVVDLDTGEKLGPYKLGELRLKIEHMMNGYYKQDSSMEFDEDGWWRTGDIVYYDENFCFFIIDRIKCFLVYQGWHVSTLAIEKVLLTHPAVKRAAVLGKPHEVDGEHPLGLVVLNEGFDNTTPEEIQNYVDLRVPKKDRLRAGVKIIKKIPLTPTGKLKKNEIKKLIFQENI